MNEIRHVEGKEQLWFESGAVEGWQVDVFGDGHGSE